MILSESDSGSGSEVEEEHDSAEESTPLPSSKKQKKSFNPEALASAFQTVLRQKLPSKVAEAVTEETTSVPAAAAPILSRRKAVERNIEEDGIDKKARKILKRQISEAQDAMHIRDANLSETLNYERSLRKLATRGVVHLFNTIRTTQASKEEEVRARRQAKLDQAYENLPLASKEGTSEQADSYFEFLKHQQQLRQQ